MEADPSSRIDVRPVEPADVPGLLVVMLGAFHDDPLYRWLSPSPGDRSDLLREMFGLLLQGGRAAGEAWCLEDASAVAVWTPPGAELLDHEATDRFVDLLERHVPERVRGVVAGMAATDEVRPGEPHWFLHSLAVAPDRQGCGLGGALLRHGLDRVDATGRPAGLDSSNPRNVRLYQRHGFVAVASTQIDRSVAMLSMHRPVPRRPVGDVALPGRVRT